eukprot:scaffold79376_cov70-Phaeocystis_antarctica.AAC.2
MEPLSLGARSASPARSGTRRRGGAHERLHARVRGHRSPHRQRHRAPSSDELSRITSHRDPPVGAAGRAAEGGQVAAQGRAGRRLPNSKYQRSAHKLVPAAHRRRQRPPGDGEDAAEARRERRPANQPRLHRAHVCCGLRLPLHRARPPAALGQPRPAGHRRRHRPDAGCCRRARGVRAGPAASQGQHRAAHERRRHRPAVR